MMMKFFFHAPTVLALLIQLKILPTGNAYHCDIDAIPKCTVVDTSEEFIDYNGTPCRQFEKVFRLDKSRLKSQNSYRSVVNARGYPQIAVKYQWKICNRNDIDRIQLDPSSIKTILGGTKVNVLNNSGFVRAGKCRSGILFSYLDTEKLVTRMVAQARGFLVKDDTVLNGKNGRELVECEKKRVYNFNVESNNSCQVQATAMCYLLPHSNFNPISCKDTIEYLGPDKCVDVPVRYEWKVCNRESTTVMTNQNVSKYFLNGAVIGSVFSSLAPNFCFAHTENTFVNTCDREAKTLEIRVQKGNDSVCQKYSHFRFEVTDAHPSSSPSSVPTLSSRPSISPTISHMPSTSIMPSPKPSSVPSSKPSGYPSPAPSVNPSSEPTTTPSSQPSSSPSASPTVSLKPSLMPTETPSISPSSRPSYAPCGCSDCDGAALSAMAGIYSCGARINWLQTEEGGSYSETNACIRVANVEFPDECGTCDPTTCANRVPSGVPSSAPIPKPSSAPTVYTICGCSTCTSTVINAIAGAYTCGERINWLRNNDGLEENAACELVSIEFPTICGPMCDPRFCNLPSLNPSSRPSTEPSHPTSTPSTEPSFHPTSTPSTEPSHPTSAPSAQPSSTSAPSSQPSSTSAPSSQPSSRPTSIPSVKPSVVPCGCSTCTQAALDTMAGEYSCGERIDWLQTEAGGSMSEVDACTFVSTAEEYPQFCGSCNPATCPSPAPSTQPSVAPCGCSTCTQAALDTMAGEYSCGARINWLQTEEGGSMSEVDACAFVNTAEEYPQFCGACNPATCASPPCGCSTCTQAVLDTMAGEYSCGARINWLQTVEGGSMSEVDACVFINTPEEYPQFCGACNPSTC